MRGPARLRSSVPAQALPQLLLENRFLSAPLRFHGCPGGRRHTEAAVKSFAGGMGAGGVCSGHGS